MKRWTKRLVFGGMTAEFVAMAFVEMNECTMIALSSLAVPALILMYRHGKWNGELFIRLLVHGLILPALILLPIPGGYFAWILLLPAVCSFIWMQAIVDRIFSWRLSWRRIVGIIILPPILALVLMATGTWVGKLWEPYRLRNGQLFISAFVTLSALWILWRTRNVTRRSPSIS